MRPIFRKASLALTYGSLGAVLGLIIAFVIYLFLLDPMTDRWGLHGLWGAVRCWGGHDFRYAIIGRWLESHR